jgi:organic hydroperoxide reductase OsmC/OhrA
MRLKKHLKYAAEAEWNHESGGTTQVNLFKIDFDTPHEYGGKGTAPCPDQLFMASLAGCIINTFNYYRKMLKVATGDLKVNVSSNIELTKLDGYRVTHINIEINVWCSSESVEANQKCAERARDFCHITKSIEQAIPITTTIKVYTE